MISSGLTEAVWFEVDEMPPVLVTVVIFPLAVLGFAVDFAIVESNPLSKIAGWPRWAVDSL